MPGAHVRVDKSEGLTASFSCSEPYLSGRLDADGTVTLERVASMSIDTFRAVAALLKGAK